MWKITTRGFTLQEVLLLAEMNLLASPATVPNHDKRASQKSQGRPSMLWKYSMKRAAMIVGVLAVVSITAVAQENR